MKKLTVIVLMFLLLALSACKPQDTTTPEQSVTATTASTESTAPQQTPTSTPELPNAKEYLLEAERLRDEMNDIEYHMSGNYVTIWDDKELWREAIAVLRIKDVNGNPEVHYTYYVENFDGESILQDEVYSKDGYCYIKVLDGKELNVKLEKSYTDLEGVMQMEDFYPARTPEMLEDASLSINGGDEYYIAISSLPHDSGLGIESKYIYLLDESANYLGVDLSEITKRELTGYTIESLIGMHDLKHFHMITYIGLGAETPSFYFGTMAGLYYYYAELEEDITPPEGWQDYPLE